MKFTRVSEGYDPKEVDIFLSELKRLFDGMKSENILLSEILREYNSKIELLTQSTQMLEQARAAERRQLSGILNRAALLTEHPEGEVWEQSSPPHTHPQQQQPIAKPGKRNWLKSNKAALLTEHIEAESREQSNLPNPRLHKKLQKAKPGKRNWLKPKKAAPPKEQSVAEAREQSSRPHPKKQKAKPGQRDWLERVRPGGYDDSE
jgi:cell division septum initiation protein DivIVA